MIMMTIAQIMEKMIAFSEGNIHDITHLSCENGGRHPADKNGVWPITEKLAAETAPVKVVRVGSFEDTFKGSFDPDARPCQGSLFVCLLQKSASAAAKKSDVRSFCE